MHTKTRIVAHSLLMHEFEFSWLKSILHYIWVCLHMYIDWKACAVWTCPCSAGCTERPALHVDYIHMWLRYCTPIMTGEFSMIQWRNCMLLFGKSHHTHSPFCYKSRGGSILSMSCTQAGSKLFNFYALLVMELSSLWCLFPQANPFTKAFSAFWLLLNVGDLFI